MAVERGIIFSGPMVLAIDAGTKTQTRRLCKLGNPRSSEAISRCPYGVAGDRLWVREALRESSDDEWQYEADKRDLFDVAPFNETAVEWVQTRTGRYCHARFMPRWASRTWLELTGVRLERLLDISEEDAKAEGVTIPVGADEDLPPGKVRLCFQVTHSPMLEAGIQPSAKNAYRWAFACAWEKLNRKRAPWSKNPWVWAVSFRRLGQSASARAVAHG